MPLDVCARHGLRRSQWPELDSARRRGLLAEVSTGMAPAWEARGAAPAALAALERRWLARIMCAVVVTTADDRTATARYSGFPKRRFSLLEGARWQH